MTPDFSIAEGDEEPRYAYTVTEPDGTVIDVTGETITFRMHITDDPDALPIVAAGAVLDGPTGKIDAPVSGPAGLYNAEFVVGDAGSDRSFPPDRPLRVLIRPRV